jgi:hypothetical protein
MNQYTVAPYTGPIQDGTVIVIVLVIAFLAIVFAGDMKGTLIVAFTLWGGFYSGIVTAAWEYFKNGNRNDAIIYAAAFLFLFVKILKKDKAQAGNNSAPQQKGQP